MNFAGPVPIGENVWWDFKVISIQVRVDPLTLSLGANDSDVISRNFFFRSRFARFQISLRRVARCGNRLRGGFPVFVLLFANFHLFESVSVFSFVFLAVFFDPCRYFRRLVLVVGAFDRAASCFDRVSEFVTRTWVFLRGVQVGGEPNGARKGAPREGMEFASRNNCDLYDANGSGGLFHRVDEGEIIIWVLCVASMGTGDEWSLLDVPDWCDDRVSDSQAFNSVGSPRDFQVMEVRVRYFNAVTPTEDSDGDDPCSFALGLFYAHYALDGAPGHAVDGCALREDAVAVFRVHEGWFNCDFDWVRYLFFGTFACTALTTVGHKAGPGFQVLFRVL